MHLNVLNNNFKHTYFIKFHEVLSLNHLLLVSVVHSWGVLHCVENSNFFPKPITLSLIMGRLFKGKS